MPETQGLSNDGSDWAKRATSSIESFVAIVRDHSLRPATVAIRIVTVGLIVILVAITLLVLLVIGLTRLLDADVFADQTWATAFVIGGIFTALGAFLLLLSGKSRNADDQ